jgi:hypothetical protein
MRPAADRARTHGDSGRQRQQDGHGDGPAPAHLSAAPLTPALAKAGGPFALIHRKGAKHKRKPS